MKLINAGLDGDVKKATRLLEEGHMFYSPKNSVRLHYESKWIYCGRSPYRAGCAPIPQGIWDNVRKWQMEDKSEGQHMTVTPGKVTITPPEGYMFDEVRCPLKNEEFIGLDGDRRFCVIDLITTPALILKPISKPKETSRTWRLKYDDKRVPIVGNTISDTENGILYLYTGHINQGSVERAYIWEEVGNG